MSVRTKHVLELARLVEDLEHDNDWERTRRRGFSMEYLTYECGTPACIAGWAAAQVRRRVTKLDDYNMETEASDWLGLDYRWCMDNLFYPDQVKDWSKVAPKRAAHVLREIAKAGDNYRRLNMKSIWAGRPGSRKL